MPKGSCNQRDLASGQPVCTPRDGTCIEMSCTAEPPLVPNPVHEIAWWRAQLCRSQRGLRRQAFVSSTPTSQQRSSCAALSCTAMGAA